MGSPAGEKARTIQTHAAMAGSILSSEAWDFVFYVFSEAHCAGHNCWHLHDPSHPRYMSQLVATVRPQPVAAVYEELDRAIGNIIEQAGDDAICCLLLSHGMNSNYTGNHLLDQVLARFEGRSTGAAQRLARAWATAWRGLHGRHARPPAWSAGAFSPSGPVGPERPAAGLSGGVSRCPRIRAAPYGSTSAPRA